MLTAICLGLIFTVARPTRPAGLDILLVLPLLLSVLKCRVEFTVFLGVLMSVLLALVDAHLAARAGLTDPSVVAMEALVRGIVINVTAITGGIVTHRIRQEQDRLTRRLNKAHDLLNLSLWINTTDGLDDSIDVILPALNQIHPYATAALFLLDETDTELVARGVRGRARELAFDRLTVDDAGIGSKETRFAPLFESRVEAASETALARFAPEVRSFAALPLLLSEHHLVGLLYVGFDSPKALSAEDCLLLEDFARRVAFAVHKTGVQEQLQTLAFADAMTGLNNYRAFRIHLEEEIRRANRYGHSLSLLLVDIDHFKDVNDRYGHLSGNRVLAQIADVIREAIRDTDIAARYGGEEFVVICPEAYQGDALVAAERLRSAIEQATFVGTDDLPIRMTISVGVSSFPAESDSDDDLIHTADLALYEAKRLGRNRVVAAVPQSDTAAVFG